MRCDILNAYLYIKTYCNMILIIISKCVKFLVLVVIKKQKNKL